MKQSNNPYTILGISPTATQDVVKKAYKHLAQKHHPDAGGKVADWLKISDAYRIVSEKKHVPIVSTASSQMVNIALDINQQIFGINEYIKLEQDVEVFVKVKIPAGALKDDKFRVKSHGKNYIINIQEKAHKDFTRDGNNLIMYKTVNVVDVMLNNPISVTGATGEHLTIELPAMCNTGTLIVVKERGLYNRKTKKYGNLRIYVALEIPKLDTDQAIDKFIKRLKND